MNSKTAALKVQMEKTSAARKPRASEADLLAALAALQRLKCSMRLSEVSNFSGLSEERADLALRELERRGLVSVLLWRLR